MCASLGCRRRGHSGDANFAVHRMRYESVDTYIGHYDYKLVRKW